MSTIGLRVSNLFNSTSITVPQTTDIVLESLGFIEGRSSKNYQTLYRGLFWFNTEEGECRKPKPPSFLISIPVCVFLIKCNNTKYLLPFAVSNIHYFVYLARYIK